MKKLVWVVAYLVKRLYYKSVINKREYDTCMKKLSEIKYEE